MSFQVIYNVPLALDASKHVRTVCIPRSRRGLAPQKAPFGKRKQHPERTRIAPWTIITRVRPELSSSQKIHPSAGFAIALNPQNGLSPNTVQHGHRWRVHNQKASTELFHLLTLEEFPGSQPPSTQCPQISELALSTWGLILTRK